MVVIRLSRGGAKKRPFYSIVVADSRQARDGRYIEQVGYFNPVAKGGEIRLFVEEERVNHWTSQGAQPSVRVVSLLKQYKVQAAEAESTQTADTKKTKITKKVSEQAVKKPKKTAKTAEKEEAE